MKKLLVSILLIPVLLSACAPLDVTYMPVTQIPFFASETPAPFIVPVTDTPVFIQPVTDTPLVLPAITDTPFVATEPPVIVPVDRWWDVYFTDPLAINNPDVLSGSVEEKLIGFINNAQTSIHIASFEFNLTPVADALIAAKNRGVDVKWMTDDKNGLEYDTQPGRGQFSLLMASGIEVKDDARSALMHNKFWVFDQKIVWTGSTNITINGIFKQNNNVLVIRSTDIAYAYEREFQEMWNGQFGPRAPSTVNTQWAILDSAPVQVLFSPEDKIVSNLIALVKDAQVSIRFLAFSFTDYPLAQTMIDRAKAGVDVKGVFETFGSSSPNSELKTFFCAGVPARQDGNGSFLHDKLIIVDNSIVVTGSLNFSSNADESNEENVVIVDNAEIAALYLQEFEKLWNQATDVDPTLFTCQ
ncbi:MAG: hypothetical protein IPO22_20285 [Anaerolineales bacterium]|nr:hypothetical protein [Anaerolineales bacterium]